MNTNILQHSRTLYLWANKPFADYLFAQLIWNFWPLFFFSLELEKENIGYRGGTWTPTDFHRRNQNPIRLPIPSLGNVEECGINPTLFFWSSTVGHIKERCSRSKLASPLYSDHPYNVFGRGGENRTHLMSSSQNLRLAFSPHLDINSNLIKI